MLVRELYCYIVFVAPVGCNSVCGDPVGQIQYVTNLYEYSDVMK